MSDPFDTRVPRRRLSLHGAATGDWDEYDAMSVDECTFCREYRDNNQKALDAGRARTVPGMTVLDSQS